MACWTVRETAVDLDALGKVDEERVAQAAAALGYRVRRERGRLVVASYRGTPDLAALKREYASLTVQAAAKRFGWKVKAQERSQSASAITIKLGRR